MQPNNPRNYFGIICSRTAMAAHRVHRTRRILFRQHNRNCVIIVDTAQSSRQFLYLTKRCENAKIHILIALDVQIMGH